MYFDPRLWVFTGGVRGRIWSAVALGLLSTVLGIARLALLGWLLALFIPAFEYRNTFLLGVYLRYRTQSEVFSSNDLAIR